MKKSLFLFGVLLVLALNTSAQKAIDYVGYWTCESTSVVMVIWQDADKDMQIMCFDTRDGEVLEVSKVQLEKSQLSCKLHTPSTNYTIAPVFRITGKGKMSEEINGGDHVLEWRRVR